VRSTPLLDSVLLSNAAPLFIPLVVFVWFGKTVRPAVWLSLAIGLAGIVLIIKPGPQMFQNPASLLALTAGFLSALALVATNKLTETEPPTRVLVYNFASSEESVGDGGRQRAASARNRWNFLQVESKDLW
jgi:drug/metabolite transporter (DMT)-like permease